MKSYESDKYAVNQKWGENAMNYLCTYKMVANLHENLLNSMIF